MYEWKKIEEININDLIHWWGSDVPLLAKVNKGTKWIITVIDPLDKVQKDFEYRYEDLLRVKVN